MSLFDDIKTKYPNRRRSAKADNAFLGTLKSDQFREYLSEEECGDKTNSDRIVWVAGHMDPKILTAFIDAILVADPGDDPLTAHATALYFAVANKHVASESAIKAYIDRRRGIAPPHILPLYGQIEKMSKGIWMGDG